MYDVAIIGGGVSGCAIARELSRYQLRVVLLEQAAEVGFGTTKTNSGIIHPGHQSRPGSLNGKLAVRGNAMFDELQRELGFGFRRIGELVVAQREDDLARLEQLRRQGEAMGVPGLEIWDRQRVRREEPNLSHRLLGALYAPTAGVINPYEFAFALIYNAVDNGVDLQTDSPVTKIDLRQAEAGSARFLLHTPRGPVGARFVVNCAGVFSDRVAQMVGLDDFTIQPRKGEEYMLDRRLEGLVRRLIFPLPTPTSKGILIIPTFDGTLMVGPTAQDTPDRHDVATTDDGARQVFDAVAQICPAISERDTITEFAGLRAVSSTGDFVIGPTRVKGFINVAGIQSPGLTASPAIAEHTRDLLREEGLALTPKDESRQLDPGAPEARGPGFRAVVPAPPRFARMSLEERRTLIAKDKLFARVICRCELVTEAEVHLAIDHGAHTLDGVKFRTRAGMGRCQGGFCTSRVMEILSRRSGRRIEEITKRGGGSWLVSPMENAQHPPPDSRGEGERC